MESLADLIREILLRQQRAIEDACWDGMMKGCGVRVERGRFDVQWFSAKADENVPLGEIHEHLIDEVADGKDLDF